MSLSDVRLSKRLAAVYALVSDQDLQVWDCACDHGRLGQALLRPTRTVHFVDTQAHLIAALRERLLRECPTADWRVYTEDAHRLELRSSVRPVIVLAGIGGDLCASIVTAIRERYPSREMSFVLCPVRHTERLRAALIRCQLSLHSEQLVEERGHFYEVLHVGAGGPEPVSVVGEHLWQFDQPAHQRYWEQRLRYWRHVSACGNSGAAEVLARYEALTPFWRGLA